MRIGTGASRKKKILFALVALIGAIVFHSCFGADIAFALIKSAAMHPNLFMGFFGVITAFVVALLPISIPFVWLVIEFCKSE